VLQADIAEKVPGYWRISKIPQFFWHCLGKHARFALAFRSLSLNINGL